jgi:hypothetical protein
MSSIDMLKLSYIETRSLDLVRIPLKSQVFDLAPDQA